MRPNVRVLENQKIRVPDFIRSKSSRMDPIPTRRLSTGMEEIMIQKNWQELIRPTGVSIKPGDDPKRNATITTEPLERGYGLTLGNALRRILLSSLQGAAIVSVQIDNVLHEFSSLAGVREDVTDIILNLKGVSVAMEVEGPKKLSINVKGPGIITAGDINESNGIEILNKDHDAKHVHWWCGGEDGYLCTWNNFKR